VLHVIPFANIYQAIDRFNAAGKNPHGPSEPNPGDTNFLEIGLNHPELPSLELTWGTLPVTGERQRLHAFVTDFNFIYPQTKAYVKRHWHRVYKLSAHTLEVEDVRLLVAPRQDPEYFGAGYKTAHDWLDAVRAVRRPLVSGDAFLLAPRPPDAPPLDIPLQLELVPEPAWWSNLRSNLPDADWQKLRKIVLAAAGDECEICRFKNPRRAPDVHEQWAYDDTTGVQRLERMIALCIYCHAAKHYGLARVRGNEPLVQEHLMKVNRWDRETMEQYVAECYDEWGLRNRIQWKLDISYIEALGVGVPEALDRARA
jgi:hypothetical protein